MAERQRPLLELQLRPLPETRGKAARREESANELEEFGIKRLRGPQGGESERAEGGRASWGCVAEYRECRARRAIVRRWPILK